VPDLGSIDWPSLNAILAAMNQTDASTERQITSAPHGHVLTNANIWSPDSEWIVYDTRSDPAGSSFDGNTIEIVKVRTGEVREIYRSQHGAHCGVATFCPTENKVVFILGPEHPTADWQYSATHRQGVIVDLDRPGKAIPLDARDLTPPYTPGALRGGSHVHVFSADGKLVSFTYDDHVLESSDATTSGPQDRNQRNVGVSILGREVGVPETHPRNHSASAFSVLVTRTVNSPQPGSDEISRACEEAWIGDHGYLRADGARQERALAFQGNVVTPDGQTITEVFVVDLPRDLTIADDSPLEGTSNTRPAPPRGVTQRRITYTADRKFPGLQCPRHWLRSSPDGSQIAMLMWDDDGIVQIWTISPNGGSPRQITRLSFDVASAFSWSLEGLRIAFIADGSVYCTEVADGRSHRLTQRFDSAVSPRPEACVVSPNGRQIAYARPVPQAGGTWNQIFVVDCD
jgi:Tol biopolymer transport system component